MNNISEEEKLTWGDVDFIEESASFCDIPLEFKDTDVIEISESENKKSPFKIIGRLAGKFAPVGGFSRNNRYYPESHWKTVLESEEVQRRLKGREMLGMIGHEDSRVGDSQIREGLISHVVSCLEIREDNNGKPFLYGEMDILDTPAGRILKAMHEGGAGLYVSSRGAGKLIDNPGKPYKTVSPSFYLETWDVVARPGFMEAKPVFEAIPSTEVKDSNLQESVSEKLEKDIHVQGEFDMNVHDTAEEDKKVTKEVTSKSTNEELETLKGQVEKLAAVLEKVVDSIYETEEDKEVSEEKKAAILGLVGILSESNIKEETLSEIIDIIKTNLK